MYTNGINFFLFKTNYVEKTPRCFFFKTRLLSREASAWREAMLESSQGCERRSGVVLDAGGVLYTSAIHILQYGRGVASRGGL